MIQQFDLQKHIEQGVEKIVADTVKATLKNPKESAFMAQFALASRKASRLRLNLEREGLHVPGFLIASITSSCNLHCAGCYSRCSSATNDAPPVEQLTDAEWLRIFREAEELGVSFILLAGGEPMLRREVLEAAGQMRNILFPVFTNGTLLDERYFRLLDDCRNLIPVLSIEGGPERTDTRRGTGVYDRVSANMLRFREKGLIFGVSVTLTTENLREVTSEAFLGALTEKGCKLVIFVEYVPVTEDSRRLAPGDAERAYLAEAMERLRGTCDEAVLLSFPGDELAMGGCMAAGREFFHINSHGGAEPCPFSPYSDVNIRDTSLREAIASPLFRALQEQGVLRGEHVGGCVLYEKRDQVEALWNGNGVIEPQEIAVSPTVAEIESRQPEADEDGTISVRAENRFMRSAINEALDGITHGHGGPFGAVIVRDGRIIGRGHNRVLADNDPTCHGEIAAIRDACAKLKSHDLTGCELYTTGEPCPMCLFACRWANIDRVYYGCTIADNAWIGFRDEAFDDLMGGRERFASYLECVDREACLTLFRRYAEMQHETY